MRILRINLSRKDNKKTSQLDSANKELEFKGAKNRE